MRFFRDDGSGLVDGDGGGRRRGGAGGTRKRGMAAHLDGNAYRRKRDWKERVCTWDRARKRVSKGEIREERRTGFVGWTLEMVVV